MPLPAGYTLDQTPSGPKLPPGYVLDQPQSPIEKEKARVAASRAAAPAAPPEGEGVISRFLHGMGIPTSQAEMQAMADRYSPKNPAYLVGGPVPVAAYDLLHTVGSELGDQAGKAIDAAQHGEIGSALRHAVGAGVPLVGPPAAEGNIAGAAGRLTGLVAPEVLGKGVKSLGGLRESGAAQYADALAPADSANRPLAESIASRLGDEGVTMRNPKKELAPIAQQHAEAIDTRQPILDRPQAARVGPILRDIEQQRDALFNEIKRVPAANPEYLQEQIAKLKPDMGEVIQDGNELVVREIAQPSFWEKAKELNKLAEHIAESSNRGMIRNDVLANLTKDYNYVSGTEGGYKVPGIDERYLPASANAADAIRNVVNQDPAAAAANSEKSMWLDAMNKLPKEAQKPTPIAAPGDTTRILRKTVLGGAATGAAGLVGGPAAAAATAKVAGVVGGGLELMDMMNRVRNNPLYRTTVGSYKIKLGKAIQAKDAQAVSALATPLMTGAGLSDIFGHDEAVHQAVTNAYAQANGDPNLARQNLFSQEVVYQNPDGSTVTVPSHVARSFVNSIGIK